MRVNVVGIYDDEIKSLIEDDLNKNNIVPEIGSELKYQGKTSYPFDIKVTVIKKEIILGEFPSVTIYVE